VSTRSLCLAAWAGAQQLAVASGAVVMTVPAFVGYGLEMADGDVDGARCLTPAGPQGFRERVLAAFDDIAEEETREQPMAAGAGS